MKVTGKGRGLLAVTAVSATTVLAMTAGSGAVAATSTGTPDPKAPAQAGKSVDKERKGNYDARTPSARATYARAAKVVGKETAASEKFRNSLGGQGVVSLDENTFTVTWLLAW